MKDLSIGLNTQTPLVRFTGELGTPEAVELDLASLRQDDDYTFTTGGVTRMIRPLAATWLREGVTRHAEWVSLNGNEAHRVRTPEGIHLSFVNLAPGIRKAYARAKEGIWSLLNGLPKGPDTPYGPGGIDEDAWQGYDVYQDESARALREAGERAGGFDLVYVHDFQQLGVGWALKRRPPAVFHLHTPFPDRVSPEWGEFFVPRLKRYDAVVVSSDRYARALRRMGFGGRLRRVYPFVDPREYTDPSPADVRTFRSTYDVGEGDRVILHVGRMDPMKGQDRAIRALPRILKRVPDAHLVLVGNGSFSSSKKGGLGLSKGARWRRHLEEIADELGVAHRVTFTGHLPQEQVPAAFGIAEAFVLPSIREGFGLAAVEAWLYGVPVVVSDGAGVAELVEDGENGFVVDARDPGETADALLDLLLNPDAARNLGEYGRETARAASLEQGAKALEHVLNEVLEAPRVAS